MPIIKSARKRVRVAAKATTRNSLLRRQIRLSIKAYTKALEAGKAAKIAETHLAAIKALDNAAKHAVIHKNKAARKKSQLAKMAKRAGVKPASASRKSPVTNHKPKTAAKPKTTKKPAAKKTVAKKN